MTLTADLTQLPLETRLRVRETLHREDRVQMALAMVEQARIAQLYRNAVGPGTTKDGIGPVSLAIHPYFVSYFRRLHGDTIFADGEFVEWLKKRGEWFHVPETGTRIQSGWTPGTGTESKRRWRKTYPTEPAKTAATPSN